MILTGASLMVHCIHINHGRQSYYELSMYMVQQYIQQVDYIYAVCCWLHVPCMVGAIPSSEQNNKCHA